MQRIFIIVLIWFISVFTSLGLDVSESQASDPELIDKHYFLDKLLIQYGDGQYLTVEEVQKLLDSLKKSEASSESPQENEQFRRSTSEKDIHDLTEVNNTCDIDSGWKDDPNCLDHMCLSAVKIFQFHELSTNRVNASLLYEISPTILYSAQTGNCVPVKEVKTVKAKTAEVWGYSFVCVTFINLCSLMGMVFLPLMHKPFYKKLLMFMVALAVGTLSGSSLLFLIPECFNMASEDNPFFHDYVWKCTTVIGGIYMFFVVERVLKNIMDWRKKLAKCDSDDSSLDDLGKVGELYETLKRDKGEPANLVNAPMSSVKTRDIHRNESINMSFTIPQSPKQAAMTKTPSSTKNLVNSQSENSINDPRSSSVTFDLGPTGVCNGVSGDVSPLSPVSQCCNPIYTPRVSQCVVSDQTSQPRDNEIHSNTSSAHLIEKGPNYVDESTPSATSETSSDIKSVAWMVIFGDGLHNFIDGLSIGAAFSKNIMAGVSVSLAVMCEELPHELGDFAILLSSGMSVRQAIGYNFLSACTCYAGLVVGILVGEMTAGSTWIFALAGGMFLYISLVDMLPEVNHASEEETKLTGHPWRIFFLQNAGLLTGYGIILLLAVFSEKINLDQIN